MRQLLQWCYVSLLLLAGTLLPMQHANAILTADCSASMSPSIINISTAITPSNADSANINATLNYTCKNTDLLLSMKVSVCLSADGGDNDPSIISPRFLKNTLNNSRLAFNMTLPGDTVWGTASGSVYKSVVHTIAPKGSISVDVPIKISLIPNNDNKLATLGAYINNFNTSGTAITYADRLLPILIRRHISTWYGHIYGLRLCYASTSISKSISNNCRRCRIAPDSSSRTRGTA